MVDDYLLILSDRDSLGGDTETNTANIAINAAAIASNVIDITNNVANIATNATNIDNNATGIGTNTTNIGTNATNIGNNATTIGINSTNISTNTTDIGTNTTNIGTNSTNIGTNTTNIGTNVTDIGTNTTDIGTNTTNIGTNTTNIGTNATNIGTNASNFTAHDTSDSEHGVTGNKDRPFAVAVARGLSAAGISALRFSFAGNGASEGDFAAATVTKEVADLGAVLDALGGRRICYAGHSMGAAVGVLRASRDERIRHLVSLAGMVDTNAFAQRKFGQLVPGEDTMWDKPDCPLTRGFMDDMSRIGSVVALAPQVRVPWLLVHGTGDEVVPLQDSLDVCARAASNAELHTLDGADHVFSGHHESALVATVVEWSRTQLA